MKKLNISLLSIMFSLMSLSVFAGATHKGDCSTLKVKIENNTGGSTEIATGATRNGSFNKTGRIKLGYKEHIYFDLKSDPKKPYTQYGEIELWDQGNKHLGDFIFYVNNPIINEDGSSKSCVVHTKLDWYTGVDYIQHGSIRAINSISNKDGYPRAKLRIDAAGGSNA